MNETVHIQFFYFVIRVLVREIHAYGGNTSNYYHNYMYVVNQYRGGNYSTGDESTGEKFEEQGFWKKNRHRSEEHTSELQSPS